MVTGSTICSVFRVPGALASTEMSHEAELLSLDPGAMSAENALRGIFREKPWENPRKTHGKSHSSHAEWVIFM